MLLTAIPNRWVRFGWQEYDSDPCTVTEYASRNESKPHNPRNPYVSEPSTWPLYGMTHSYVRHDSLLYVTWRIQTHTHTHSHTHTRIHARACAHACIRIHKCIYMYTHIYTTNIHWESGGYQKENSLLKQISFFSRKKCLVQKTRFCLQLSHTMRKGRESRALRSNYTRNSNRRCFLVRRWRKTLYYSLLEPKSIDGQ